MKIIKNPFKLLWIKTFGKKQYEGDIENVLRNLDIVGSIPINIKCEKIDASIIKSDKLTIPIFNSNKKED